MYAKTCVVLNVDEKSLGFAEGSVELGTFASLTYNFSANVIRLEYSKDSHAQ